MKILFMSFNSSKLLNKYLLVVEMTVNVRMGMATVVDF